MMVDELPAGVRINSKKGKGQLLTDVLQCLKYPSLCLVPYRLSLCPGGANIGYIQGMGKMDDEVKIILDVSMLLYEKEMEMLKGASKESGEKTEAA